jgi:hypothetical protein
MTFGQRRNRLTTHFSERIPVLNRPMTILKKTTRCNMLNALSVTHCSKRRVFILSDKHLLSLLSLFRRACIMSISEPTGSNKRNLLHKIRIVHIILTVQRKRLAARHRKRRLDAARNRKRRQRAGRLYG